MFQQSTSQKLLDQWIWGSVGIFITGYTCWHFNLLPSVDQLKAQLTGNYHTVEFQAQDVETAGGKSLFSAGNKSEEQEFDPSRPEPVLVKSTEKSTTQKKPASAQKSKKVEAEPATLTQQEPAETEANEFNSIWQKSDSDENVTYTTKSTKKEVPALPTSSSSNPENSKSASGLKTSEYEPVLLTPPVNKTHPDDHFLEQGEPADQKISPAIHEEPAVPTIIDPWADEPRTAKLQTPKSKDHSDKQAQVQRTTPHYNDVMRGNISYSPERNQVKTELIPGHSQKSNNELRFVNNQQLKDESPQASSGSTDSALKKVEQPPLLQQPITTGQETTAPAKTVIPQDDVLRLRELSQIYWNQPAKRGIIEKELNQLAKKIFFEKGTHYLPSHKIAPGDQLTKVAKKYDVPWEYLARLNQVNPAKIRAGDVLKVQQGPFSAVVDLSDFELTIHNRGYYVCRFTVGTGKNGSTPRGTFKVKNKEVNPVYYGPEKVIDRDDPANPLGERWLDLGDSYGIHGTNEPDSIGKAESKGCIRMKNTDVELVYDLLVIGSEVTIRD